MLAAGTDTSSDLASLLGGEMGLRLIRTTVSKSPTPEEGSLDKRSRLGDNTEKHSHLKEDVPYFSLLAEGAEDHEDGWL